MDFDFIGYEPVDIDEEVFLSDIPIDILESSIKEQFNDPLEYRKKDYIQSFITKYEYSQANMMEDDLVLVEAIRDNFMKFVKDLFYDRLKVGFVDLGDMGEDDQHELVHLTYRFFIKHIKKNFVNVVHNYIREHKEEISESYERKKDVTSNTFKGELTDEYDVIVLTNLGDIITNILDTLKIEADVDSFLTLCNGNGTCLELEYVKHAYATAQITGNFVEDYVDMVDDTFKIEIQSKIRSRILKKYPVRSKRAGDIDENEDTSEESDTIEDIQENETPEESDVNSDVENEE